MMRAAVFFDRDGVVNESPGSGYVLSWDAFRFAPGLVEALKVCVAHGYVLVLVTSQQGVGKGLMTQLALDEIHLRMQAHLREHGCAFEAIYACTCLSSDPGCTCRKPSPEMVERAAVELGLDLRRSWLVGDADRDIQMAVNAGVPCTVRVESENPHQVEATHTVANTGALANLLESSLPRL